LAFKVSHRTSSPASCSCIWRHNSSETVLIMQLPTLW
jgi:hypothetical protein